MSNLRDTILAEEELVASKRRFGLFSQAPPIAVGDDGEYKKLVHLRGQNGKPVTKAPNMLAGSCRSGTMKSSYFSVPESIHTKDPYKQQYKRDCQDQKTFHTRATFHETQFKPGSGFKTIDKASYKYTEENPRPRKLPERDQAGKPRTKDKNCTTNPISKVQTEFFKNPAYMSQPYDRKKDLEKKDKEIWRKKIQPDAPMFRSMSHGSKTFNRDIHVYGEDAKAKAVLSERRSRSQSIVSQFPHQTKFKLARRGHGDTIGDYPKFIEKKTMQTIDTPKKSEKQEGKESWKPNNWGLSRPTPSISYHPKNLKIGKFK